MGKKTLKQQFRVASEFRFREHVDKHALKLEGKLKDCAMIFGYSTLYNLRDFAYSFCRWLDANDRRHAFIKDIPVEDWNDFLEDKSKHVGYITLKNYESRIRTWEKIVNAAFNADIRWSDGLVRPYMLSAEEQEIQRVQQMQREDFEILMDYIREKKLTSKAIPALEIAAMFGLRVEGTARIRVCNVHLDAKGLWGFGTVDITEKGNKDRTIDIKSAADRKVIEGLIEGKASEDRLVPIKKESVNKFMNRIMTKTGIKEKYPETSIHSFRKLYAQETWDNYRDKGRNWDDALRYVNRQLGHGEERNKKLLAVYVKNMW